MAKTNTAHEIVHWLKMNWIYIILTFFLWFGINAFAFWLLLVKLDVSFFDSYVRGFLAGWTLMYFTNLMLKDFPE